MGKILKSPRKQRTFRPFQKATGRGAPTEAILESISDGVFTVDMEWRITSFNRAAEEITGVPMTGFPLFSVRRSAHSVSPVSG
jgi:PAS domain-containing protein